MRRLALEGGPFVSAYAATLKRELGGCEGMAERLEGWLRSRWIFEDDPRDVELVRAPELQLRQYSDNRALRGDCDDAAVLAAALGVAAGLDARYRAIAFDAAGTLAHVYAELHPPGPLGWWFTVDPTRPAGPVPDPTAELYVNV